MAHPLCARLYIRPSRQAERLGLAARRVELLDGLAGKVIEVGAGNGPPCDFLESSKESPLPAGSSPV
jgi:hypothetical protein